MKVKFFNGFVSMTVLGLVGCSALSDGVSDTALIPPSANYQANYVPLQPPMQYQSMAQMPQEEVVKNQRVNTMTIDKVEIANLTPDPQMTAPAPMPVPAVPAPQPRESTKFDNSDISRIDVSEPIIPNSPMLSPNNIIELNAVGMGVAPETAISPSQALALAKRAAIVDAYRQIGEKMYGIKVNAQDTVKDMMLQNSVIKTRVQALIRNAEITETVYKDGLCQVSMELRLDGKVWHRVLAGQS